ncbi:unnamed protein product [Cyclocybe aegerita]|uniref:Uncharacterized protein n=1 Tax=Cyclocybe aegerita TaxID=1973307 RepID=A0A8S0W8W9_CYCAE|nr:unnamed protein product [Cyclocybe aegerita]
MSSLVIPLVSTTLPTCKPDLMPFHIDYDGPAPVSAFMRSNDVDMENATQDARQAPTPAITWSKTESTLVVESQASSSTSISSTSTFQQPPAAALPPRPRV